MAEFKGSLGNVVNEGGDNNSIDLILGDNTTITLDRQCRYTGNYVLDRAGMNANANLVADAFNVRQQINCDLPELLRQHSLMKEMLKEIKEGIEDGRTYITKEDITKLLDGLK